MTERRVIGWLLVALLLGGLSAFAAGRIVTARETDRLVVATAADARLRATLLVSEIARFRLLPLAMADDRDVVTALSEGRTDALNRKLEALARQTGAAVIYLIGPDGRAIASSNWRTAASFVGNDYLFRRYYRDALALGAGEQFALGTVSRKPGLYLARRTATARGVVVVKLDFDRIEQAWRAAGGITFATNPVGVVLVTSRPDWRFAATVPLSAPAASAVRADSGTQVLQAPPFRRLPGRRSMLVDADERYIEVVAPPGPDGWRVHLAVPAASIAAAAGIARAAAALIVTVLLVGAWALRERGRRRAKRTAGLEAAVAARTAELSREIEERAAAEARAADLREGLRQANRLATLGQITAGVAHETAQPVAAIRTYAANAEQFLLRGEIDEVRGNLRAIGRLTERIGTVTAELRGFARRRSGDIGAVPLIEVVEGARLILKERLAHVAFEMPVIPADLIVLAGRVRLEQVLVILLQNALEAVDGHAEPRIVLSMRSDGAEVSLTVKDNGPGIAAEVADRLFTPFATSRANGLGLGLVIAQDIMTDLGGSLRLLPGDGGACFDVTVRRA